MFPMGEYGIETFVVAVAVASSQLDCCCISQLSNVIVEPAAFVHSIHMVSLQPRSTFYLAPNYPATPVVQTFPAVYTELHPAPNTVHEVIGPHSTEYGFVKKLSAPVDMGYIK